MPSSPNGPCSTGNDRVGAEQPAAGAQRAAPRRRSVQRAVARRARTDDDLVAGRGAAPSRTEAAESSETSCSDERPPARTATLTASAPCVVVGAGVVRRRG